jgi:hypothetical protein
VSAQLVVTQVVLSSIELVFFVPKIRHSPKALLMEELHMA